MLVEPPATDLPVCDHAARQNLDRHPILDTTLGTLRDQLVADLGWQPPIIVTGHQPEFFHAGVFAKNIAAAALAARAAGTPAFLMVDSDLPKSNRLILPQTTAAGLRQIDALIPGCEPQVAYESQPTVPREHWLQFFARLSAMHELFDHSLLRTFAKAWLEHTDRDVVYADAWTGALAACESALGVDGLRTARISHLAQTRAFRTFAAALISDARQAAEAYNAAQQAYRRRHRVRAAGRPVPPLMMRADLTEVPLWIVRRDEPRRRLFVRDRGAALELSTDNAIIGELPHDALDRAATHADPWPLERDGWSLRPRALTLSAFARLVLADIFIHGIGGAKYDEIMEEWLANWRGITPAPAVCVSATLHLPLAHEPVTLADIRAARHRARDLRYNPQRHLANLPSKLIQRRAELVRASNDLRRRHPRDHERRAVVFREIRHVNEEMLQTDPWRTAEADRHVQTLERDRALTRIARDREYFFALHREDTLEALVKNTRTAIVPGSSRPENHVGSQAP